MIARPILAFLAALLAISAAPAPALACSCMPMAPCQSLWLDSSRSPIIFEGTVESIERRIVDSVAPEGGRISQRSVLIAHLKDIRNLLGEGADTVTTSGDGAMCGYNFEVGKRYVIDANQWQGSLSTGLCTKTAPIERAGELLAYIATLSQPPKGARVTGQASISTTGAVFGADEPRQFLAGATVSLDGPVRRTTITRADGSFEFDALPIGAYRIALTIDDRPGLRVPEAQPFTLASPYGCYTAHVPIQVTTKIEGTVLDPDGKPVRSAHLALRRADGIDKDGRLRHLSAMTDEFGRYEFANIPGGRYVLGLNIDSGPSHDSPFLPVYVVDGAGPEVLDVPLGGHRLVPPLTARAASKVLVTGRVVWPDGRPAAAMRVRAMGHGEARFSIGSFAEATSDATGRFAFDLYADQPYVVRAHIDPAQVRRDEDYELMAEADVVAGSGPISLVMTRRK